MLTRELNIGGLLLGGLQPVRVQSMTNTATSDTVSTVSQCVALAEAGCEMVRITARNVKEAAGLRTIRDTLRAAGIRIPLIADIHFQPAAAEVAARIVDKIRINPGNFAEAPRGDHKKPSGDPEIITRKLKPLLEICNDYGTAVRIGVNQGSLSDRILRQFGDTPAGMVASAIEYIEICRALDFHRLVISLKSSDVRTMILAYRMLERQMSDAGYNYPLHLGVTEAGGGLSGIIKSSAGTGALLADGIGDTIRVSLTGDPLQELNPAKCLVDSFPRPIRSDGTTSRITEFVKRENIPGFPAAFVFLPRNYHPDIGGALPDFILQPDKREMIKPDGESILVQSDNSTQNRPYLPFLVEVRHSENADGLRSRIGCLPPTAPVMLGFESIVGNHDLQRASALFGALACDGLVQGLGVTSYAGIEDAAGALFGILQALGLRRTQAEFIACPTCGRTSYDVERSYEIIRRTFGHLSHLKIGVMGCIVNGPGEMADADYGFVGSGKGSINLYYKGKAVRKSIPEEAAIRLLEQLIRENGDWRDIPEK